MNKLKPCPFCGTPYPYVTFERGYLDDSAIIFCNACKISVKLEENDQEGFNDVTKKKAIEAWNRRASIEPERKKGKWKRRIVDSGYNADWICSECGYRVKTDFVNYNFCLNCGADMRGEKNG